MRATRATIAGLGTSGSLVAAAVCVFIVASAVIAFRGWPGFGLGDKISSLLVDDSAPIAVATPGPAAVAAAAVPAAGAVAPAPTGAPFGAVPTTGVDDSAPPAPLPIPT